MTMEKELAGYPSQIAPHLTLRRVLGEGGTSVVFEAFHTRLKVPVAVKLLAVSGSVAEQARARLRREAELYALLDDPRIPRVYDVDELPDGTPYVVMEFVPGSSLESLVSRGPLSAARSLTITREVLAALAYVHGRGVLHRDVKPANVILNELNGRVQVRLVDFGIAKAAFDDGSEEALTQQGTLVGTPHYMAPERLLGRESDANGDTYAVGVMLYEMLTGVVPFGGPTLGEVIASVLRDHPRSLRSIRPEIPQELELLVAKAMSRDPGQRFQTAAEMLDAVTRVLDLVGGEVSAPRLLPVPTPGSSPGTRPLSSFPPPTLEVVPEDDLAPKRARSQPHKPLLAAAACAVALWAAWPGEVRDLRVQNEPSTAASNVAVEQAAQSPSTPSAASQVPSEPAAGAIAAMPSDLPSLPPSAAEPAPEPAANSAATGLESDAQVLVPEAPDNQVLAPEPELALDPKDLDPKVEGEPTTSTLEEAAPSAPPAKVSARRRNHRVSAPSAPAPASSYEPVRSVPLQPLLDRLDNMLQEPEPKSRRAAEVPENPY